MLRYLLFFCCVQFWASAQTIEHSTIFNALRTYKIEEIEEIENYPENDKFIKQYYNSELEYLKNGKKAYPDTFDNLSEIDKVFFSLWQGDAILIERKKIQSDSIAYTHYTNALNRSKNNNWPILVCESYKRMLRYQLKNQQDREGFFNTAQAYRDAAYDDFEKNYALFFLVASEMWNHFNTNLGIPKRELARKLNDGIVNTQKNNFQFLEARLLQLLGVYYDLEKNKDLPLTYYTKALNLYNSIPYDYGQKHSQDLTFNIASYHIDRSNSAAAKKQINKLNLEYINKKDGTDLLLIYDVYYQIYHQERNLDSALYYLKKTYAIKDSLSLVDRANSISEFETKYKSVEKEKQFLIEKAEKEKSQKTNLILVFSLLLSTIIAFLIYRNTKRKQRIAEQEKELEFQRTEKVLKEKEIETINAMVEGQEKERQRLAGDLHDSIGGTLAALKMHLGTMENTLDKKEAQEQLLAKANILISDAYTRVRKIAHERNSGVMAKDGLLPAIQRLARNVSNNSLTVNVQDFGLDKRLHTDLEITIFRIVQELVTNVIKHAQATEATISLTQHEDELNILIEDNGIGFKVGRLEEKEGMGLGSIERRVEHLEGTMVVDSTLKKGTHIIIDIPL